MYYIGAVVLLGLLIGGSWSAENQKFPTWFKFGAATAAYQVEGGWNASDKGENIWDHLLHTRPEVIEEGTNGDVACDSYHQWRRDIDMVEELGLHMYRFSISWSRLLPTGFPNYVSEDGKKYYNDLIDRLLEKGIEPIVTVHHFDLPQSLLDLGGWANPLITDWFADYARVVFSLFADRVKIWLTLNEPFIMCDLGYDSLSAPALNDTKIGKYLCNKNVLLAHAKAWRLYDEEFRPKYHGKVSLTTLFIWYEPATPEDEELCKLTIEHWEGRYAHAIYSKEGGWPPMIEKYLAEQGKKEGYPSPRLPPFTPEEIELVRGTYDFYGLNHYTTRLVRKARPGEVVGAWPFFGSPELQVVFENDPTWQSSEFDWLPLYPEGLRHQLHWINQTYGVKEIIITENGFPTSHADLQDWQRVEYIRGYLEQLLVAINEGIPVTGYNVWSLMDNFEWFGGYGSHYGLYAVNYSDPVRARTPRESARFYASVIKHGAILLAINDGIRVIGYSPWSLMDNFEWLGGYTIRFGLYAVNFSDPLRRRTPRDSARYYATVTRSRAVHPTHNPLNYV